MGKCRLWKKAQSLRPALHDAGGKGQKKGGATLNFPGNRRKKRPNHAKTLDLLCRRGEPAGSASGHGARRAQKIFNRDAGGRRERGSHLGKGGKCMATPNTSRKGVGKNHAERGRRKTKTLQWVVFILSQGGKRKEEKRGGSHLQRCRAAALESRSSMTPEDWPPSQGGEKSTITLETDDGLQELDSGF